MKPAHIPYHDCARVYKHAKSVLNPQQANNRQYKQELLDNLPPSNTDTLYIYNTNSYQRSQDAIPLSPTSPRLRFPCICRTPRPRLHHQPPIHFKDAAIKQVYKDDKGEAIYSVIGSLTFNETGVPQVYHIDTSQWAVDVSSVITSAE
jgi:hypothetical protein